jgi:hypothetical protein
MREQRHGASTLHLALVESRLPFESASVVLPMVRRCRLDAITFKFHNSHLCLRWRTFTPEKRRCFNSKDFFLIAVRQPFLIFSRLGVRHRSIAESSSHDCCGDA